MKMIIDITKIISQDLKSRSAVADLLLYISNTKASEVTIDFANVKFATRSFIDEYYNSVVLKPAENTIINNINIPFDIQFIFDAVKRTQHKKKNIKMEASIIKCNDMEDLKAVFANIHL